MISDNSNKKINVEKGTHFKNRQKQNRRKEPSKGYIFISPVGWVDRRARLRRKDDSFDF